MSVWRRVFPVALVLALALLMPLRVVLGLGGGPLAAEAVTGSVWNGKLEAASLSGERLGDLDAGLSFLPLFLGKANVRVDGALIHGAILATLSGSGVSISTISLPLSRIIGPVRLAGLEANGVNIRYRRKGCAEAEGRVTLTIRTMLGEQRLSGDLRCSGQALAADLVSQSAMQRISVRFPGSGRYEATLVMRTTDPRETAGLAASGFHETPAGHVRKMAGLF